jgi:prepilin-type N-terminal cleavage/methylation domain-containing protein
MTRMSTRNQSSARGGFTLTELLVVIAIIAVLVALVSAGVMTAMSRARATAIKIELDQIDAALKRYKDTYGSYPPCNLAINEVGLSPADRAARLGRIKQHLAMAFPRYTPSDAQLELALDNAGLDLKTFRPDQALVFWLRGFSPNPMQPIVSVDGRELMPNGDLTTTKATRTNVFFEFEPTRLLGHTVDGHANPAPSYFPLGVQISSDLASGKAFATWLGGSPPIVYFSSDFYQMNPPDPTVPPPNGEATSQTFNEGGLVFANAGVAAPYWHDSNGNGTSGTSADAQENWCNPDSFQLICAGRDGKYGTATLTTYAARLYPTGTRYDLSAALADDDNATNFTSAARIGDDKP